MLIYTTKSSFLIEGDRETKGCVIIQSDSNLELQRFFGSLKIESIENTDFSYQVKACKQEFANALILMVKEIDYNTFANSESVYR